MCIRDRRWLIYDIRRAYGYYYDLKEVRQVTFGEDSREGHLVTGCLLYTSIQSYIEPYSVV